MATDGGRRLPGGLEHLPIRGTLTLVARWTEYDFAREDNPMRTLLIPAALAFAMAGAATQPVQAKGCIKGAVVGGLAGHAVHHGILGAGAGCIAGHHLAKRHAQQERARQARQNAYGTRGSASLQR